MVEFLYRMTTEQAVMLVVFGFAAVWLLWIWLDAVAKQLAGYTFQMMVGQKIGASIGGKYPFLGDLNEVDWKMRLKLLSLDVLMNVLAIVMVVIVCLMAAVVWFKLL